MNVLNKFVGSRQALIRWIILQYNVKLSSGTKNED